MQTVIVDNSPYSYAFHPQNAFPISSFVDNLNDDELLNAAALDNWLVRTLRIARFVELAGASRVNHTLHAGVDAPTHDRTAILFARTQK